MADTVVGFLLEDLKQILSYSVDFILDEKDQFESLYEDLEFIRAFLNDLEEKCNCHEQLKLLVTQIRNVACEALDDLDAFVCNVLTQKDESIAGQVVSVFDHSQSLKNFREEIKSIRIKVMEIYNKKLYGIGVPQLGISSVQSLSRASSPTVDEEEIVVGLDDEVTAIAERLTAEQKKLLDVISVVGMAGIGKTTLASKVYNDPFIVYHFYVRGWTCVSQVYRKRDMLLDILSCVVENKSEIYKMSEEKLGEELYRRLKGLRYLIVIDDIWNIGAWEELKRSFPNDGKGSRIMLTTRLKDVALHINPNSPPHYLRFLTRDESWDLLQKKAFPNKNCPLKLKKIGREIAAKCKGLPLAISVIGGLLAKKEKTQTWWEIVANSVSSYIVGDAEKFMDILALSYQHLPHHLKLCFLYFGEFLEDDEIPVWRLIWLWIAEGFVKQTGETSLEEIAEDYLMDLIDRNLVLVSKKRSKGGVKACRIHDMLRDLCLSKAKEMNCLQQIDLYERVKLSNSFYASPTPLLHTSLCFHSHGFHYSISGNACTPHVGSLLTYASSEGIPLPSHSKSFIYKLLKVLDLGFIYLNNFPDEVLQLFHLRHLKLHVYSLDRLPPEISNLWNLETLVIDHKSVGDSFSIPHSIDHKRVEDSVSIPHSILEMVKLRHLCISGKIEFEKPCSNYGSPSRLDNLQTLSALALSHSTEDAEFVLERTPNLRKLELYRCPTMWENTSLPDLASLNQLDTLKLIDKSWEAPPPTIPQPNKFPPNLKKLTLSGGRVDWKKISNLGKLPNLEVLKLGESFFSGRIWRTSDGEFGRLKYLKLSWMDLQQWITSTNHFPSLQRLILDRCMVLQEIPSCVGDIPTMEMIEISWSSRSAMNSARKIQEDQQSVGNDELKILIRGRFGMVRSKGSYDLQALHELACCVLRRDHIEDY